MNDEQRTTSGTNEAEKSLNETVKKILSERNDDLDAFKDMC